MNSQATWFGIPLQGDYTAAKAAARIFMDTARMELKHFGFNHINSQTDAGDTPLMWAVKREKSDLVELTVQKGATVDLKDNKGCTPLAWACGWFGHGKSTCFKCAEILIQNGADVNAAGDDGHTPLYWATAAKDQHITEMPIKHGA